MPGTRIGSYEVIAAIAAGGMGEVYRARNARLNRDVALKILPHAFTSDPDRLARFKREAQVLASLNHPNIAAIYGFEEANGIQALVLELVEGATLDERIARAPSEPTDALPIAAQIADAIDAAHEKGIVHRDLKPANIKLTEDGRVKVLDFGLAKALGDDAATDPSLSPTTIAIASRLGVIVGTAAYMAPEQAKGKPVDKRADIWAFACVLYEMLTGRRAFPGEHVTDFVVAIMTKEPDWAQLLADTPSRIVELLQRCLRKDPRERLRDIGDARIEIDFVRRMPAGERAGVPVAEPPARRDVRFRWAMTALAVAAALALAARSFLGSPQRAVPMWRGDRLGGPAFATDPRVSPDGQMVAFQVMVDGLTQVGVMRPDAGQWTTLTSDRAHGSVMEIAWSPDGSAIYFDRLNNAPAGVFRVPILGGEPRLVLDNAMTPAPLADGSLVAVHLDEQRRRQLVRFWPDTGRMEHLGVASAPLLAPAVRVLPDGREAVFFGHSLDQAGTADDVMVVDLTTRSARSIGANQHFARTTWTFPLAVTPDGAEVLVAVPDGDAQQIVALSRSERRPPRRLFELTGRANYIDAARNGEVYADLVSQSLEVFSSPPTAAAPVRTALPSLIVSATDRFLPLPDGRLLVNVVIGGQNHMMVVTGTDTLTRFLAAQEQSRAPITMLGRDRVALIIGSAPKERVAIVSIRDGHIISTLDGVDAATVQALAGSSDGTRLFYVTAGAIWVVENSRPAKRFHAGDGIAIDPESRYAIVEVGAASGVRLIRVALDGSSEQEIAIRSDLRPRTRGLRANAVARDGRIIVTASARDSWFSPVATLDPRTGRLQKVWPDVEADMFGGWTTDGRVLAVGGSTHSILWRFKPSAGR